MTTFKFFALLLIYGKSQPNLQISAVQANYIMYMGTPNRRCCGTEDLDMFNFQVQSFYFPQRKAATRGAWQRLTPPFSLKTPACLDKLSMHVYRGIWRNSCQLNIWTLSDQHSGEQKEGLQTDLPDSSYDGMSTEQHQTKRQILIVNMLYLIKYIEHNKQRVQSCPWSLKLQRR